MGVIQGHMVSKGYLAAWADRRNTVDVIDIQGRRGFVSSINSATTVRDVYGPKVLSQDLEAAYADIEAGGIPGIRKLIEGEQPLTDVERDAIIAFLDMHLDRGRYAGRAQFRAPALVLKAGGGIEEAELRLGDALVLSQALPAVLRLRTLGLDRWDWKIWPVNGLVTGDGGVLLWRPTEQDGVCTVSFPLSPTRLLVIGQGLPDEVPMNDYIASNSKRWIVGARGSLNFGWAEPTKG